MMSTHCRCACPAAMLIMLAPVAGAAPEYFSVSAASGEYSRALALNDAGSDAVNSAGPEIPFHGASINGWPISESVGGLGGYITQIRSLNNLGRIAFFPVY